MKHQAEFDAFVKALQEKLEAGERKYGEASFQRSDTELQTEVREELLDVCGWSFVRWCQVKPQPRLTPIYCTRCGWGHSLDLAGRGGLQCKRCNVYFSWTATTINWTKP